MSGKERNDDAVAEESNHEKTLIVIHSPLEASKSSQNTTGERKIPLSMLSTDATSATSDPSGSVTPTTTTTTQPSSSSSSEESSESESDSDVQQEDLPTQPLDENQEEPQQEADGSKVNAWGNLVTQSKFYNSVDLVKRKFFFGRREDNDYCVTSPPVPHDSLFQFSRIHFIIERRDGTDVFQTDEVFLHDKSLTGTFVNGELVGKDKTRPLIHGDVIAAQAPNRPVFSFVFAKKLDEPPATKILRQAIPVEVLQKYLVGPEIGAGSGGKVFLGFTKDGTNTKVAIKIVEKLLPGSPKKRYEEARLEGGILRLCDHPCVVKLHELFVKKAVIVIILEFCPGGELFDLVVDDYKKMTFNERVAKVQMYQILQAVKYLHAENIIHRDLKLENILVVDKNRSKLSRLKVTDFGLSKIVDYSTAPMTSFVGTIQYIAPEVLRTHEGSRLNYTSQADMWSLGCLLYSLLCGSPAFHGKDRKETEKKIHKGRPFFGTTVWQRHSHDAVDLVKKLLSSDPKERPDASQALRHPWFTKDPEAVEAAEVIMAGGVVDPGMFEPKKNSRGLKRSATDSLGKEKMKCLKLRS